MTKLRYSFLETTTTIIIPRYHDTPPSQDNDGIVTSPVPTRQSSACHSALTLPPQHHPLAHRRASLGKGHPRPSKLHEPNAAMKPSSATNAKSPLAEWSNTRDSGRMSCTNHTPRWVQFPHVAYECMETHTATRLQIELCQRVD